MLPRRGNGPSLHVRLDDASAAALDVIRASGMSDSDAVRFALREAAARRANDEDDREKMQRIRELARHARGHEQRGAGYAVIVQADEFPSLSTTLVAPHL